MSEEKKYDFSIDDYCACDVFEVMNEDPNWPENKFLVEIIIDMLKKDVEREVRDTNFLVERIFTIMLIYKYIADVQNGRMILILKDYSKRLNRILGPRDSLEKRLDPDSCYSKAIANANKVSTKYGYSLSYDDRLIGNIRNYSYIMNFARDYAQSEDAKNTYKILIEAEEWLNA